MPGTYPSISTIQSLLNKEEKYITEGEFRFDIIQHHLSLVNPRLPFVQKTVQLSFLQFHSMLALTVSLVSHYLFQKVVRTVITIEQNQPLNLEEWFSTMDKSSLLNLHMIQPITSVGQTSSPIILSAYGTNSKYKSVDIIRRWLWIFEESLSKGIRIVRFSTDGIQNT